MCTVCGCGQGETKIEGGPEHAHAPTGISYAPRHHHHHAHAPGLPPGRMVQIEQDILAKNNGYASANRKE